MFKVAELIVCDASVLMQELINEHRQEYPDYGKAPASAFYLENVDHEELVCLLDALYALANHDEYVPRSSSSLGTQLV